MKHTKFLSVLFLVAFASCDGLENEKSANKILSFIPGSYARSFEGEFAIGNDTLVITQPDIHNNYYAITHNSSYQKIREKQLQPFEHKSEKWVAVFNEKNKMLEEQQKGKLISFLPEENALLLGSSKYYKIK